MASTPKPTSGSSSSSSSNSTPKPNSTTRNVDKFGNVTEKTYDDKGNLSSQTRYNEKAGNVSRNPVTGKNEVTTKNPLGSSSSSSNKSVSQPANTLAQSSELQSVKTQLEVQRTGAAQKVQLGTPMQSRQTPNTSPFIPNTDQIGKYKIVNSDQPTKTYTPVTQSSQIGSQSYATMAQQSTQQTKPKVSVLSLGASVQNASYEKPREKKIDVSNLPKSSYFKGSTTAEAEAAKTLGQITSLPKGMQAVYSYDPIKDESTGAIIGTKVTKRDYMTLAEANDYARRQTPQYIADAKDIARTNAIVERSKIRDGGITQKGVFSVVNANVDTAEKFSLLVAGEESRKAALFLQNAPTRAINLFMGKGATSPKTDKVFGIDEATFKFLAPPAVGLSPTVNSQNVISSTEAIATGVVISPLGAPGAIVGGLRVGGGIFSLAADFGKQVNYELLTNKSRKEIDANYFQVRSAFAESQRNAAVEGEKPLIDFNLFGTDVKMSSADLPLLTTAGRFAPNFATSENLRKTVAARDAKAEQTAYDLTGSPVISEFVRQQRAYSQTASDIGFIKMSMSSNDALAKFTTPIQKQVIGTLSIPFVKKPVTFSVGQELSRETATLFSGKTIAAGTTSNVVRQIGTPLSFTKRNVGSFLIGGTESAIQTDVEMRNQGQNATATDLGVSFVTGGISTVSVNSLLAGTQALSTIGRSQASRIAGKTGNYFSYGLGMVFSPEEGIGDLGSKVFASKNIRSPVISYANKEGLIVAREGFSVGNLPKQKVFATTLSTNTANAAAPTTGSSSSSSILFNKPQNVQPSISNSITNNLGMAQTSGENRSPTTAATNTRSRSGSQSSSLSFAPSSPTPTDNVGGSNTITNSFTNSFTNTNTESNSNSLTSTLTNTNTFQNFPFFPFPGSNKGSSPASGISGIGKPVKKKKTAYLPSVSAVFLNIRAKKGKRTQAAAFTGIGIRPILR